MGQLDWQFQEIGNGTLCSDWGLQRKPFFVKGNGGYDRFGNGFRVFPPY